MRISRRNLIAMVGAGVAAKTPDSSKFVRAEGKHLLTPDGKNLLLRGINLGNWMETEGYMFLFEGGPQSTREMEEFVNELIGPAEAEQFWKSYRRDYITRPDMRFIRDCGFNSVRIPLHYKYFLDDGGFQLLDPLIGWCREFRLWAILDMHCAPGGQTGTNIDDSYGYPWLYESEEDQQQLAHVWKRIAAHYRDEAIVLGYDLLNEPVPHYPRLKKYNGALEPIYKRVTGAIRSVDSEHLVILGGAQWDSNFAVFGPPFDAKLVYQFHKYWTSPGRESIVEYLAFRDRYNVPIWCGESGENKDEWVRDFAKTLEQNETGWCFWTYKKMSATSCVTSIRKPPGWDEIVTFGKLPGGTGNAEKRIAARPSLETCRSALNDLLQGIRLENCHPNPGYLQALGLKVPGG